jgi:transposase
MGCEPVLLTWPPLRLARIVLRARIGLCRCPAASPVRVCQPLVGEVMVVSQVQPVARRLGRAVGLDLHRDFCVIAICEEGLTYSAGRVPMTAEGLESLVASLGPSDRVVMEVSGSAWEVARRLEGHVNRVVVVSPDDTGIAQARTKTDKLDARTLAYLLWKGQIDTVWVPDERARVLRRRLSRREQLVHARSRAKNEVHAMLMRRLQGKPPCSDLFGVKGRKWLRAVARDLPVEEAETVQAALRHIAFLDKEIEQVEQLVAKQLLTWPEAKRLLTVPGVNLIAAATFLAAVGDITRFSNSKRVVAYLGLDPRVRQSGETPARSGSISKRGSVSVRWALVEATWSVVHQPGPLRAFYLRVRSRRGHGKAIVATARKLAILFWCMLTREQDYAHQQPSLTAQKLRRLEIAASAPVRPGKPSGVWVTHQKMRHAEKQLAAQAQASYERTVRDWKAAAPQKQRPKKWARA